MANSISETGVVFFSAGGHSHDGIDSSVIDVNAYSLFDFKVGQFYTTRARQQLQQKNEASLRSYIINVVNTSVLDPAGIVLQDNIINSRNIIAGSITSEEIAANTITANNIAGNTITGDLIAGNTILGTSIVSGSITAEQLDANAITSNSITVGANDFWASNGYFRLGGTNGISYNSSGNINIGSSVYIAGNISGASGTFSGSLSSNSGSIGGWQIQSGYIWSATTPGTTLWANGAIISGNTASSQLTVIYPDGTILANKFTTAFANSRIEIGPGATSGSVDEIFLYDSGGTVGNRTSLRANNNTFIISSAGGGGVYTFSNTAMTTARGVTVGSVSASSTNLVISSTNGYIQFITKSGLTTYNSFISGSITQSGYFWGESLQSGSVSFPSFSFSTDSDTGMYLDGSNDVRLAANGKWGIGVQNGFPIANLSPASSVTYIVVDPLTSRLHTPSSKLQNKESIEDIDNSLSIIKLLKPRKFNFKAFPNDSQEVSELRKLSPQYGFIAEEVAEVSKTIGIDIHESEPKVTVDLDSFFENLDIEDKDELSLRIKEIKNSEEYKNAEIQLQQELRDLDSYVPSYWKHPHIIALAIAAIKELTIKIEELESKILGE